MATATESFFEDLRTRDSEPMLASTRGQIKFELHNGGGTTRWLVGIDHGAVTVSRRNGAADCVVRTDSKLFDQVVSGRANMMSAVLRGAVITEGHLELLMRFQRLFPGPAGPHPAGGDDDAR